MSRRGTWALLLVAMAGLGAGWARGRPVRAELRVAAGRTAPLEPAVVVDAVGRVVGPVILMLGPLPLVRLRTDGLDLGMFVFGDRLAGVFLLAEYESADCTGAPWLPLVTPPSSPALIVELAAVGQLGELLVASGDAVTRTVKSRWNSTDTPPACDPIAAENHVVKPTRVLTGPGVTFTPPFRLR